VSAELTPAIAHPPSQFVLGVDLGGTNIVVGAMPLDGSRMIGVRSEPTHAYEGADAVVARIVRMARDVMDATIADTGVRNDAFVGVGIGSPGPLDRETGVVLITPNLGWTNFPLRDRVAEGVGLPAALDNDANCATLGEWWIGAAQGAQHVIGLTIGTGIGGGIIVDGALYHGATGIAGELGHITIDAHGRRCGCGNDGCLEAYASGPAIAQRAREALDGERDSVMSALVNGDLSLLTAHTVFAAAEQHDAIARDVVRDTARFLGIGIANLLNIFNPEVVVIAGGVTQAGETLFAPLRAEVRRRAFKPAVSACRIVPGTLPGTAGVAGAIAMYLAQRLPNGDHRAPQGA